MEENSGVAEFVWEKTTIYFSEQLGFHRKPIKFPTRTCSCARAHARANHAINDAQKGCAMQLNGITLIRQLLDLSLGGQFTLHQLG